MFIDKDICLYIDVDSTKDGSGAKDGQTLEEKRRKFRKENTCPRSSSNRARHDDDRNFLAVGLTKYNLLLLDDREKRRREREKNALLKVSKLEMFGPGPRSKHLQFKDIFSSTNFSEQRHSMSEEKVCLFKKIFIGG